MRKVYKKLTADQKMRGIVFSSTLSRYRTELSTDTIHELKLRGCDEETRLLDDKFFNNSHYNFNIIRR